MLNLSQLSGEKRRWIALPEPLSGVNLQVRHVGPREQQAFRRKMIDDGILKSDAQFEVNRGRERAFYRDFAKRYVTDWSGDVRLAEGDTEAPAYDHEKMGEVFETYGTAFVAVTNALADEAPFFSTNGASSPG